MDERERVTQERKKMLCVGMTTRHLQETNSVVILRKESCHLDAGPSQTR